MRVDGKLTRKFPWTKKAQNGWLVRWLLSNISSSRNTVIKKPYPYRPNPNPKHNRAPPKRKCVVNMNNSDTNNEQFDGDRDEFDETTTISSRKVCVHQSSVYSIAHISIYPQVSQAHPRARIMKTSDRTSRDNNNSASDTDEEPETEASDSSSDDCSDVDEDDGSKDSGT